MKADWLEFGSECVKMIKWIPLSNVDRAVCGMAMIIMEL